MALELIPTGGGTATADSISIPQTDLAAYGVTDAEMTADNTGLARAVFGVIKAVQAFDMSSVLGMTKPGNPGKAISGGLYINRTYSLTSTWYVNLSDSSTGVVPLPSSGANSGLGGFALTDIFPNAVKVAASAAIGASALLIPSADLTPYDASITHGSIDITSGQDNRLLTASIYRFMVDGLDLRSATETSAFIASSESNPSLQTVPANFIDATDPLSGIDPVDVADGHIALLNKTMSLSIQTEEDLTNDTLDVRVATT